LHRAARPIEGRWAAVTEGSTVNIISITDLVGQQSTAGRGLPIVTADDCRSHVIECLRLRNTGEVSAQRVRVLVAMMKSWVVLANQIERYEAIVQEENNRVDH
jgi:hypothetical protein